MPERDECFRQCLYSTPYATIVVIATTIVSFIGFASSSAYGLSLLTYSESLHNSTPLMASLVGGVACSSVLPLVLATLLAYSTTGHIRSELYCAFIKTCVGYICNSMIIMITFASFLVWLLMAIALSVVMMLYSALKMGCSTLSNDKQCGTVTVGSFTYLSLCPYGVSTMEELCYDGLKIGISFAISLGFCLLILIGLVSYASKFATPTQLYAQLNKNTLIGAFALVLSQVFIMMIQAANLTRLRRGRIIAEAYDLK